MCVTVQQYFEQVVMFSITYFILCVADVVVSESAADIATSESACAVEDSDTQVDDMNAPVSESPLGMYCTFLT